MHYPRHTCSISLILVSATKVPQTQHNNALSIVASSSYTGSELTCESSILKPSGTVTGSTGRANDVSVIGNDLGQTSRLTHIISQYWSTMNAIIHTGIHLFMNFVLYCSK